MPQQVNLAQAIREHSMRSYRTWLIAVFLSLAGVAHAHAGPGDVPPDFLGRDANGHEIHVHDLHGKVVLITFWASWCGYCLKELPILASIQKVAGPAQLQVVAISYKEDYDNFRRIHHNLRKESMLLTYDSDASVSKAFGVNGIPHLLMIDRDGRIAHVHVGYGESMLDTIIAEVNALLATQPPAGAQPQGA
jgi:thiol-disulfide isomerase/thioredoxin